jgi:hypothetical protein
MSCISCDSSGATRTAFDWPNVPFADVWRAVQLFTLALTAGDACGMRTVLEFCRQVCIGSQQTGVTGISYESIICQ